VPSSIAVSVFLEVLTFPPQFLQLRAEVSTGLIVPQKERSKVLHFFEGRMRHNASRFLAISVFVSVMSGADPEPKIDEDDEQTWSGGHVIDAAGRKRLPQGMSKMLARVDHGELVHRAGARAHVMAHARDQLIAGIDLAAPSSTPSESATTPRLLHGVGRAQVLSLLALLVQKYKY
jgi:hypothetical protein